MTVAVREAVLDGDTDELAIFDLETLADADADGDGVIDSPVVGEGDGVGEQLPGV